MIDFAKYAFNKSHAAAYAVVSYQTAYLKLLLSQRVYGRPHEHRSWTMQSKFSEYLLTCRRVMGVPVLPPDITRGREQLLRVRGRHPLQPVPPSRAWKTRDRGNPGGEERNSPFRSMEDFVGRMSMKESKQREPWKALSSQAPWMPARNQAPENGCGAHHAGRKGRGRKNPCLRGQLSLFDIAGRGKTETNSDYISGCGGILKRMGFLPLRRKC